MAQALTQTFTAILKTLARLMVEVANLGKQSHSNGNEGGRAGAANSKRLPPPPHPTATFTGIAPAAEYHGLRPL